MKWQVKLKKSLVLSGMALAFTGCGAIINTTPNPSGTYMPVCPQELTKSMCYYVYKDPLDANRVVYSQWNVLTPTQGSVPSEFYNNCNYNTGFPGTYTLSKAYYNVSNNSLSCEYNNNLVEYDIQYIRLQKYDSHQFAQSNWALEQYSTYSCNTNPTANDSYIRCDW